MADLYSMFQTDKSLETEGIWYDFDDETGFRLARAGGANVKFAKAVEEKTRPHRRQIDNGTIDPEVGNRLLIEAFVGTVLLDWKGVRGPAKGKDEKGNDIPGDPVPFNRANAIKLLTDMPDLFNELRDESTKMANFRNKVVEDDAGN